MHDKKTHSSSLDDDLVFKIRFQITGDGGVLGEPTLCISTAPDEGSPEPRGILRG